MKKTMKIGLSILVGLILVSVVIAIYNNREEAISYFNIYKTNRESNKDISLDKAGISITYTTDKICKIDYNSERISCSVCFSYEYNGSVKECISVSESSTKEEIDLKIREEVNDIVDYRYNKDNPIETVEYTDLELEGVSINLE